MNDEFPHFRPSVHPSVRTCHARFFLIQIRSFISEVKEKG